MKTSLMACALAAAAFQFPAANAATEKVLYSFQNNGSDGTIPYGGLIYVKGMLYGTTSAGGANGVGTVFSIDPSTGKEKVLYSFRNNGSDGQTPYAGLTEASGTLYGTTVFGGTGSCNGGCGTVYSVSTKGAESVIHSFLSNTDGAGAYAALIDIKNTLYGTTYGGGDDLAGTAFSITPGGTETVLYSFLTNGSDGNGPYAGLFAVKGTLYGTTGQGGTNGNGTVFSLDAKTKAEKVIYSFKASHDGFLPYAALTSVGSTLYGTTIDGGAHGAGTVFSVTAHGKEKVLYSFAANGHDGEHPYAGLLDVNGTLYGTTNAGGSGGGGGTIFSVTATGTETVLYSFQSNGVDGINPYANMININGTFYGTTSGGGANGQGAVFSFTP